VKIEAIEEHIEKYILRYNNFVIIPKFSV